MGSPVLRYLRHGRCRSFCARYARQIADVGVRRRQESGGSASLADVRRSTGLGAVPRSFDDQPGDLGRSPAELGELLQGDWMRVEQPISDHLVDEAQLLSELARLLWLSSVGP
jgi:hypothetical protein